MPLREVTLKQRWECSGRGGGKCSSGGRGSETWNRLRVFVGRASVCHQDTAVSPRSLLNGVSHTLTPRKCKIMPLLNGPWLSKYS